MPIKFEIQTNINEYELTVETCSEIIKMLQETYKNMRKEMYNYFLGEKNLKRAVITASIILVLYLLTKDLFFIYLTPISVFIVLLTSVVSAEYLTSQSRKQLYQQIQLYKQKRIRLMDKEAQGQI